MTSLRMQPRTPSRDEAAAASVFHPMGKAVMDALPEGIVVFDPYGRMVYANQSARSAVEGIDALTREKILALGGRATRLRHGAMELGEALFLPTRGRLAEAARRLGISRTTLWRRLRAYGVRDFRTSK